MRRVFWLVLFAAVGLCAPSGRWKMETQKLNRISRIPQSTPWKRPVFLEIQAPGADSVGINATSPVCIAALSDFFDFYSNSTCSPLFSSLDSDEFDPQKLCSDSCFTQFVSQMSALNSLGCLSFDANQFDGFCASKETCSEPAAEQCVNQWISMGCPSDIPDEMLQRCQQYAYCAAQASRDGRCSNKVLGAPSVPLNCRHLHNCSGHGACVQGKCVCNKGFGSRSSSSGGNCSEYLLDLCPERCSGHGNCVRSGNTWTCSCLSGYEGQACSKWVGCQNQTYCSGHGTCEQGDSGETCKCFKGYGGATCNERIPACPKNCSGRGICVGYIEADRLCSCDAGFTGPACDTVQSLCPSDCSGRGYCKSGNCTCAAGFLGSSCGRTLNICRRSCGQGYCDEGDCKCSPPFSGPNCDLYNADADPDCQELNFCSGYGVCHKNTQGKTVCTCFETFGGERCNEVEREDSCPNFCSGRGRCLLQPSPHCSCIGGWSGPACDQSACPTHNFLVCNGHGVCENKTNGVFGCTCDRMWSNGADQACEVASCPNNCSSNGECTSEGVCVCNAGLGGVDCSQPIAYPSASPSPSSEPEPPVPCLHDCSGNGDCQDGVCICKNDFVGEDCSIPPVPGGGGSGSLEFLQLKEGEDDDVSFSHSTKLPSTPLTRRSMASLWD